MRTIGLVFPKEKTTKEPKGKEKATKEPEGENDEVQE